MAWRKKTPGQPGPTTRLDRMAQEDVILALESSLLRTAELFRGLTHRELDQRWVLEQMAVQIDQASQAVSALRRKVDI